MPAPPTASVPTSHPDPHQDWRAPNADARTRTSRVLGLVRALIDYGKQLASTLQQRSPATNLTDVTRHFGTIDIAWILSCITRGLHRAAELEARLANRLTRQQAAPAAINSPTRRQPRAAPPEDESTSTDDPPLARMPTPRDIAARVRHRPVGAVLADICRDLGIVASHPLWRELSFAIIEGGGNLATLVRDIFKRLSAGMLNPLAAMQQAAPEPHPPSAVALATGPP